VLCKHEVVGSIPSGSTSRDHFSSMRTLIRRARSIERGVLSDIVKRGSYQACEHEKSCARVHVFAVQLRQADILLRRGRVVSQENSREGIIVRKSTLRRDTRQQAYPALLLVRS
jgi:hypothetical protein